MNPTRVQLNKIEVRRVILISGRCTGRRPKIVHLHCVMCANASLKTAFLSCAHPRYQSKHLRRRDRRVRRNHVLRAAAVVAVALSQTGKVASLGEVWIGEAKALAHIAIRLDGAFVLRKLTGAVTALERGCFT